MPQNDKYDFSLEKQRAAERLKELSARSKFQQSVNPPEKRRDEANRTPHKTERSAFGGSDILPGLKIPLLDKISLDSDIALILGLVLILAAERSDRLLLLALLYILM